ncbi:hypothetical protein LTR62_000819 [Meristemomyces frigidus]|uniref:DUF1750-domain-containing protein n=1 Tax=Meristemomyces frigidus TaxID=1508187 RepID=A0AAN7TGS9_9PEZI|nr:hypothetical protein LTR62_000819 [Meristemomyces frigidus]
MQNPSQGVAPQLQNHVHLLSNHHFPTVASLKLDHALKYLLDAPVIVKSMAPMSWTYIQAPQDGSIWLEWLAADRGVDRFPSDGYVWGDNESSYRHDIHGYTVEMMKHTIGYRLQYDQMASHARTRYHIVAKNPSVNAGTPDPSLWIVHYHQAEQHRILPSSQVPHQPQMQQTMTERRWLESQGKLERREFMLHDRASWPMINVPSGATMQRQMQQPGFYGAGVQQNRYPQYYPQQAGAQGVPPAAKRQRTNPPVPAQSGDPVAPHDFSIEDEENTQLGDYFDHISPREISMARYTQHHRWMEEVFSSPYASNQIVPADLGMGLMGELKGLTDGILEPPSLEILSPNASLKPREAAPFTNLSQQQLAEFEKRVAKHLEAGQAEIERMKTEHAAKIQEWKKSNVLMSAEKRLRYATWEAHESATPIFRVEEPAATNGAEKETVEDIVKEVESALGVKISTRKSQAEMIEKGGLEQEEELPQPEPTASHLNANHHQQNVTMAHAQAPAASPSFREPLPIYHGDSQQMAGTIATMQREAQQPSHPLQQQLQQQTVQPQTSDHNAGERSEAMQTGAFNNNTSLLEDAPMQDSEIDFGVTSATNEAAGVGSPSQGSTLPSANAPDITGGLQSSTTSAPAGPTTATAVEQARGYGTVTLPSEPDHSMAIAGGPGATNFESLSGTLGAAGDGDSHFEDSMFGNLDNDDVEGGGVGEQGFEYEDGMGGDAFEEATFGMDGEETEGGP